MVRVNQLGSNDVGYVSIGRKKKGMSNRTRTILLIVLLIAGIGCVYYGNQMLSQSNSQPVNQTLDNPLLTGVTVSVNNAETPTPTPTAHAPAMFSIP